MSVSGEPDRVDALLEEAARQPFVGWDFSWLRGRLDSQPLPWDYTASVVEHARSSPDLLDLGTGGGEWLGGVVSPPPRAASPQASGAQPACARARPKPPRASVVPGAPAPDNKR